MMLVAIATAVKRRDSCDGSRNDARHRVALASGEVQEPKEIYFLMERLKAFEVAEKASPPPESRHPRP